MFKKLALAAALTIAPAVAFAENQPSGGAVVGGPVGAVAGGVGGAVGGAIVGGAAELRFRSDVVEQRVPSCSYAEPVAVGTVLPEQGVVDHPLPAEYGPQASRYNYTVVNERPMIVEPQSRRVVPIIA